MLSLLTLPLRLALTITFGPEEDCTRPNTDPLSCPYCGCPLCDARPTAMVA